jgi:hypothetical protein
MTRIVLALSLVCSASLAFADGAIICKSDSKGACAGRQYCCYAGNESDGDKLCQKLGCVRGGTSSCPTAANVSSCGTRDHKLVDHALQSHPDQLQTLAW